MPMSDNVVVEEAPPKERRTKKFGPKPAKESVDSEAPMFPVEVDQQPEVRQQPAAKTATPAATSFVRAQHQSIRDWISGLGSGRQIKIQVHRVWPEMVAGRKVNGYLGTHSDMITDEDIQGQYGGGKYQIKVQTPNTGGSFVYLTSTTVDIAGDPRLDNMPQDRQAAAVAPSQDDNPLVKEAWKDLRAGREKAEAEAARLRDGAGGNFAHMSALLEPLRSQIDRMQASMDSKDRQIQELLKPKETVQDEFVKAMLFKGDSRLDELRKSHEDEIRKIRDNHRDELARLEAKYERERDIAEAAHQREVNNNRSAYERELSNMKAASDREVANLKQSGELIKISTDAASSVQKTVLEAENRRLEKQYEEVSKELRELRAKKDQTIKEKVEELNAIKDLVGDGGEADEKSTITKVVETVVQSEQLMGTVGRWFGPKETVHTPPAPQEQQQLAPPQRRRARFKVRKSDGQVFQQTEQGLVPVTQNKEDGTQTPVYQLDETEALLAVKFVEAACQNNVDPAAFAVTARTKIPENIMLAIRREGVDGFLTKVVQLEANSPLNLQSGRNWLRKVAKELLGEDAE